ncbi:hypothetical protein SLEP1_g24721 [Rubroshorea leprosula]|uniref:Uncharacterized protein n=1 Tax=Rubroshorea leprosula TaxID=152421 RepID=A0AAV5JJP0_9ROSI|nr:hypothetical protein SLEP1_g24721 [Rubroshorea leprosula]
MKNKPNLCCYPSLTKLVEKNRSCWRRWLFHEQIWVGVLPSAAAGEQQMRVVGILGGWMLLTSCAEQLLLAWLTPRKHSPILFISALCQLSKLSTST